MWRVLLALLIVSSGAVPVDVNNDEVCLLNDSVRFKETQALVQTSGGVPDDRQPSEYVTELTAGNIAEHVHPLNKNTVINIYAPWCPVSTAFEPIYGNLAEKFAVRADLTFAEVNGDNDVDLRRLFNVKEYPTVVVIPKGTATAQEALDSNSFLRYTGSRSAEKIGEWLETITSRK